MALENLDNALADITTKIQALAQAHGAEAVKAAGYVYQLDAAGDLLQDALGVLLAVGLALLGGWLLKKAIVCRDTCQDKFDDGWFGYLFPGCIALIGGGVVGVASLLCLATPLTWAAAFDPNLAIAAHVLKLL